MQAEVVQFVKEGRYPQKYINAETYQRMTLEELVHRIQVLFLPMNSSDQAALLLDIQAAAPDKFPQVWEAIKSFASKEALLVALAEHRLQERLPLVEGLEAIQDARERLRFLVDFILGELLEETEKLRFYNSLYLNSDGVRAIEQAMQKFEVQYERLFRAERKLYADLGVADPDLEAIYIRSLLQGIRLEYMLGPKDYPLQEMKQKIFTRYQE